MRTRTKVAVVVGAGAAAGAAVVLSRRGRQLAAAVLDEIDHAVHSEHLDGEEVALISHDGAQLAVTSCGPIDGPVVVLAHCWTGSRNTWAPVARRLVAEGCRVVRWDQRGHGRSLAGHKGHTVEGLADDLCTVLEQLDLHDVVLAGHSLGGMTVQAFATHHHDVFHERTRAAVLVATGGANLRNPLNARMPNLVRAAPIERAFQNPVAGRMMVRSTFGRAAHRHHLETTVTDFLATPPHVRFEFLQSIWDMDLRDGIAKIDVPTSILVGSRDTLTPVPLSRLLAATIPGAELTVLPGLGHMLPYEAPAVVAETILHHVRRAPTGIG